jgi:hypothetical protein
VNDRSIPGMASTCEGYEPGWEGGREDGATLDAAKRTLTLEVHARDQVEQIQEKKISSTEEQNFYRYAYEMQCTGSKAEPASLECQDLKRANEQGVYFVRMLVTPKESVVIQY